MTEPIVESFEPSAPRADYGEHEPVMQAYFSSGRKRALALPNQGPLKFLVSKGNSSNWPHVYIFWKGH